MYAFVYIYLGVRAELLNNPSIFKKKKKLTVEQKEIQMFFVLFFK